MHIQFGIRLQDRENAATVIEKINKGVNLNLTYEDSFSKGNSPLGSTVEVFTGDVPNIRYDFTEFLNNSFLSRLIDKKVPSKKPNMDEPLAEEMFFYIHTGNDDPEKVYRLHQDLHKPNGKLFNNLFRKKLFTLKHFEKMKAFIGQQIGDKYDVGFQQPGGGKTLRIFLNSRHSQASGDCKVNWPLLEAKHYTFFKDGNPHEPRALVVVNTKPN